MGVSGSGKTSVATAIGAELGYEVIEGDAYHPPANIDKMAAGIPLTDEDRRPWLETLVKVIAERHARGSSTVLACSALRRAYRDVLRAAAPADETVTFQLDVDETILRERMSHRQGHYMPVNLIESQVATLEPLEADESGVVLDASRPLGDVVADAVTVVRSAATHGHGTLPTGR
jgi:gluconokinase